MIGKEGRIVLNHLQRALTAEEKQGCTNTGAVGGFHSFLRGIISRLEQLLPDRDFRIQRTVAEAYADWSPIQRRQNLAALKAFIAEMNPSDLNDIRTETTNPREYAHTTGKEISNRVNREAKEAKAAKDVRRETVDQDRQEGTPAQGVPDVLTRAPKAHDATRKADKPSDGYRSTTARAQPTAKPPSSDLARHSLQYIKGVGPERARLLQQHGLHTVKDLLLNFPRRYEDRRLRSLQELKDGEISAVTGKIVSNQITRGRLKVVKLILEQEGRIFNAIWFNQTFIVNQYPVGMQVIITGKVRHAQSVPEIMVTDIQKIGSEPYAEIIPVYSEFGRLSSKVLRNLVQSILPQAGDFFPEVLQEVDKTERMPRGQAYREIHFPQSFASLGQARERLVFEEILFLQLAVAGLRQGVKNETSSPSLSGGEELVEKFYDALPFALTAAQKRVIAEIFHDMENNQGMARLVQGDVGSGKTAVAMAALLKAVGSDYQGVMMAPTEILAQQHFQSLQGVLTALGVRVTLLIGSLSKSERERVLREISDGVAQVVVGTQALIQETVIFKKLGLAVTDEQHRFGVKQRSLLQGKGENPHVLVLTATPIPRTLALTLYGDLQLSVLDELPEGRKPIITSKLTERGRPNLEKFMEEQIAQGRQVYVVCPLVEESENLDLISATQRYESMLQRFPEFRVNLLHGRMKGAEKEEIMNKFKGGEIEILVSTTVIEVGVNVPNATVMVVEGAERFGLAQLHQLRGRVGRGSDQSYCILISDAKSSRRLQALCETQDGFKIAEEDLRIRGAGELLGTRQHGLIELRLADLTRDGRIVEEAYRVAQKLIKQPELCPELWAEIKRYFSLESIGIH